MLVVSAGLVGFHGHSTKKQSLKVFFFSVVVYIVTQGIARAQRGQALMECRDPS